MHITVNIFSGAIWQCKARFPLPELTARVNGPSWRVTGFHYPSTRVVETGLKCDAQTKLSRTLRKINPRRSSCWRNADLDALNWLTVCQSVQLSYETANINEIINKNNNNNNNNNIEIIRFWFLTCVSITAHDIGIGYPSVRPSHAGIMSKRLNLSSNCLHCLVAPWF